MIITRTPLRISFAGGGSDLPSFYREEPGAVVSATIDKYIYVTLSSKFDGSIRVAYSRTEDVQRLDDLQHELAREALRYLVIDHGVEIHSIADVPGSTGLGSSSAFTVGALHALDAWDDPGHATAQWLAEKACIVEIERCCHPIGKQDHYAAAFGGVNFYRFLPDESVTVESIACDYAALGAHMLLLYTGTVRQGDAGQAAHCVAMHDSRNRADVRAMANLAHAFRDALTLGEIAECGEIMDAAWWRKRAMGVSSDTIDAWYTMAKRAGAWGGKLCGAGGGGFLCFLAPPERHDTITQTLGLRRVPVAIVLEGSTVVYCD